jgi:four helix bundle protein
LQIEKKRTGMTPDELKARTKAFGLRVIRLAEALPRGRTGDIIGRQLVRCGTSVGANYRAACRARSQADFIAKMHIVEEEADESLYWLDILGDAGLMKAKAIGDLRREAEELLAITIASINTARRRS